MRFVSYFTDDAARKGRRAVLGACVLMACATCLPAALPTPALGASGGALIARSTTTGAPDISTTPPATPLISATLEQCLTTGE
ncbi:MAG: hypothetical protein ACRDK1_06125, partial [Solirubrobacterales bacterium]